MQAPGEATVISCGYRCSSTFLLIHLGMSNKSYPFDWTMVHQPALVAALTERLQNYLTDDDCPAHVRAMSAPYVHLQTGFSNRYGAEFFHVFNYELEGVLGDQYATVQSKIQRRCHDFTAHLDSGRPIILMIYQDRLAPHPYTVEKVKELVEVVRTNFPTAHFQICVVQDVENRPTLKRKGMRWQLTEGNYLYGPTHPSQRHEILEKEMRRMIEYAAKQLNALVPRGYVRQTHTD